MSRAIIKIKEGFLTADRTDNPINLEINEGEQIAIIGPNASGKTTLAEIICGRRRLLRGEVKYDFGENGKKYASENIRYISFRDSYGTADAGYYYQQRWNQGEIDPQTPTVREQLSRISSDNPRRFNELIRMFSLDSLMDKYVITLSSGELRKFQLTKMLVSTPGVLVIDNPFIGLDASSREQFASLLASLAEEMCIIIVVSREEEIPPFITHIIPVRDMQVSEKKLHKNTVPEVLRFTDVSIRYSGRTILKNLNWCVHRGEKWALTGENGAGKSLLLSLVCADNPQAYACNISLFGRRRGTGESIWEIKRHIGYVSPEMHRSFNLTSSGLDIVSSGHFDTVGVLRKVSGQQTQQSMEWMSEFGISHLAERSFKQMSSGEQRLCLLARAFVKNPLLLVLDEPMHGLDEPCRMKVRDIINRWCTADPHRTLIMVTHYMEELPSCIDHRLVLLKNKS